MSTVVLCALITSHDEHQQEREEKLAYFFPSLIQVLSVLIYEESLLFTEAMKLIFHKSGISLPAKADQRSSFETQNGESGAK